MNKYPFINIIIIDYLPFCSNLAGVTDMGILSPGLKGDPSRICNAKATEGS